MCESFIKVTPEMFLIIYGPFGLKLKLSPLKDHTEEAIRELKQQRFGAMDVNRKWTFCIIG